MTTLVRERSGTLIRLPNDPPMNSGGEGQIHRLSPHECLKIFHQPLKEHEVEKIHYLSLVGNKLPGFAWPIEPVRPVNSSTTCGFVMPLISGETLDDIIDNDTIPKRRAIDLCVKVATAVRDAHAFQHATIVLGDVIKGSNLMISGNEATFIDCASASLLNLRYRNGTTHHSINRFATPGNTAPERVVDPQRHPDQHEDLFALAVLLFEILFGMPPYKPKPTAATIGFDPDEYVTKGYFFRFVRVPGLEAPTYPKIKLPHEIDRLFRLALLTDTRPSAAAWVQGMTAWANFKRLVQPQPKPQPAPQPASWYTPPQPNIPLQTPAPSVFGPQAHSSGPVQPQVAQQTASPFVQQAPINPQPHVYPQQPFNQQPATGPQPTVSPQPTINPQPPIIPQPQPVYHGGWQPPQTTTPLLVPIRQIKHPIRVPLPSPQLMWRGFCACLQFFWWLVCKLFSNLGMPITAIVDGFDYVINFLVDKYVQLGRVALRVVIVIFLSTLGYRVVSADLDTIPHNQPSKSFTITHLLHQIFGPDGYIPVHRYRNPYRNDPEYPHELPPPPSKEFGPNIMDQVL